MADYFEKKGDKYFSKSGTHASVKAAISQPKAKDPVANFKQELAARTGSYKTTKAAVTVKRYAAKQD